MAKRQKKDLQRIIIALVLFIPLFIVEHMGLLDGLPYTWMPLVICLVPYLIVGHDVILKAWHNIKNGQIFDENFLMMIATFGAFVVSEYIEAVAVMLFYQVGELFQSYAVGKSRESIASLMEICPEYANLEVDGELEEVDPGDVEIDSIIVIKPGEKVPLDGVVIEGSSFLDTSALTGESVPRKVNAGEDIISGCINGNGTLRVRVTKEFDDSTVSKILELVENATNKKAKVENFITRFAKYYTPFVTISALLLAVLPPIFLQGNWLIWLERACTFLVVSCPCALVISVPMGFFGGIGAASKEGVLVKGSNYLELLSELDVVVFDKTGTLTNGVFEVTEVSSNNYSKEVLLQLAASVERFSTHPIAESICVANTLESLNTTEVEEISGHGISGKVNIEKTSGYSISGKANIEKTSDCNISGTAGVEKISGHDRKGKTDVSTQSAGREADTEEFFGHSADGNLDEIVVLAGNYKLMQKNQIPCEIYTGNGTVVYIAVNGAFAGYIVISDTVKTGAADAVTGLKKRGVSQTVMLTGDRKETALSVAKELGVDEVYYELLPADKVEQVETLLQQVGEKKKLAFVGDGINDAPVLARADIGIAMGSLGSDAAIEAADIVIMDDDIRKISNVMKISKKTMTIVKENIVFALGVKGLVLILGAVGRASMWAAVFADVGVAVIAILNSMRMLKK